MRDRIAQLINKRIGAQSTMRAALNLAHDVHMNEY